MAEEILSDLGALAGALWSMTASAPQIAIPAWIFLGWRFSLRKNPYTKCIWCSGNGRFFGWLARGSWRRCSVCGGSGSRVRFTATASEAPRRR